jgi:hypothetical protein
MKWWGKGRWEACRQSRWKVRSANQGIRDRCDRPPSILSTKNLNSTSDITASTTPHVHEALQPVRVQNVWSKLIDECMGQSNANNPIQMLGNVYKYASLCANTATQR